MRELSSGEIQPGPKWKNCIDILLFFTLPIKERKRSNCKINVLKLKKKKATLAWMIHQLSETGKSEMLSFLKSLYTEKCVGSSLFCS